MMCKLVLATLAVYLCLEAAYGQHSYGLNPGQQRHATGFNPNQNRPHATGFNPNIGSGRHYRDLSSADTGRKVLAPQADSNGPARHGFERGPGPVIPHH
ncbi:unnamed protein product [Diabrotica balteata]|uniref:Hymenoptaecin n=1 Tax=Diabrotica balteata TaxID=107213 RepID=A0A9N9T2L5_DIABA|nr:unnamed protein product [Diabrotica balteata]